MRTIVETIVGPLLVAVSDLGLRRIVFGANGPTVDPALTVDREGGGAVTLLDRAVRQIEEYFRGERIRFDLPLDLTGVSVFRDRVLREVAVIPYGALRTYGELARSVDSPGGARAVGGALARNPVPIVVPCHRVVASSGGLGGFTAGGEPRSLELKRTLLRLEERVLAAR